MKHSEQELGTVTVLLDRLAKQRLPRLLAIKAEVDKGECLNSMDLQYLGEVLGDSNRIRALIEKFPEHRDLVDTVSNLYHEVTAKALENEKQRSK